MKLILLFCFLASFSENTSAENIPHTPSTSHNGLESSTPQLTETTGNLNTATKNQNEEAQKNIKASAVTLYLDVAELTKKKISKEFISDLYLNTNNLNRLVFDNIINMDSLSDSEAKRLWLSLGSTLILFWVSNALTTIGHERAHAEAGGKTGCQNILWTYYFKSK